MRFAFMHACMYKYTIYIYRVNIYVCIILILASILGIAEDANRFGCRVDKAGDEDSVGIERVHAVPVVIGRRVEQREPPD